MTVLPLAYLPSAEVLRAPAARRVRRRSGRTLREAFGAQPRPHPRHRRRDGADGACAQCQPAPPAGARRAGSTIRNAGSTSIGARWSLRTRDRPISISTPNISSLSTAGSTVSGRLQPRIARTALFADACPDAGLSELCRCRRRGPRPASQAQKRGSGVYRPNPMCRSFPTACLSSLICLLRTRC